MAIYIGGDTETLEYSTLFKKPNELHPVKIWRTCAKELIPPSKTGKPNEAWDTFYDTAQNVIDKYSKLDNDYFEYNSSAHDGVKKEGRYAQIMIEVDLNQYCQDRFNGDNNLLRENFKSAAITTYAMGCAVYVYGWDKWNGDNKNHTNEIKEISFKAEKYQYILTNNKMYVLVRSMYPSTETVDSSLSIDYFQLELEFKREPDKIEPIDVELGDKWSMLIKDFAPNWDSENAPNPYPRVLEIKEKLLVAYRRDTKTFYFEDIKTGTTTDIKSFNFPKFKIMNILITQNAEKVITLYILDNGGTLKKVSSPGYNITGIRQLYILQNGGTTRHADAFLDKFELYNNQTFTECEIEEILRENKNLIPKFNEKDDAVKPFWTINPNTTVSEDGNSLTLNADSAWQFNSIKIPVFPNNKYIFKGNRTAGDCYVVAKEYYNNYELRDHFKGELNKFYHYIEDGEFTTLDNCNFLYIECGNREPGTFTFSDLELKLLQ
ncbi:hypothetical protein ACOAKC_01085 [Hathewaya histolytica]|uniref:hypothetical protein n=1 Tax=Hathewaya histolytica TaxID=1498 RepID=UPI003B67A839